VRFYTDVLGFRKKHEIPVGEFKWLTVVSPEGPDDIELSLEPNANPAAKAFQEAMFAQGIPLAAFEGLQAAGCRPGRSRDRTLVGPGVALGHRSQRDYTHDRVVHRARSRSAAVTVQWVTFNGRAVRFWDEPVPALQHTPRELIPV
jgi:hypothetical protein